MSAPTENESWVIDAGDLVIGKEVRDGLESLTPWEKLVYCLWVADYGMRNAGDLETARDVYADFQSEGRRLSGDLSLMATHAAFSLPTPDLQREYFHRFEEICEEIRGAEQAAPGNAGITPGADSGTDGPASLS